MPEYKVKITVVKNFGPEDVFGEKFHRPSGREIVKCDLDEGDAFIVTDGGMPDGFCHHIWFGMYPKVTFIRYGGESDDWVGKGVDYVCCPD
ncbi:MAG: TIGR04076 family protein [Candidatus Bathyarchaeota archaeon]